MNHPDIEYLNLANRIFKEGIVKEDRTGTGTISLFGPQMEFDLSKGFPILTTKKLPIRIIGEETLFFLRGDTDLKSLLDKNVHIWDDDAYRDYLETGGELSKEEFLEEAQEEGYDLGPIYGAQWVDFNASGLNQLEKAIETIKNNPDSRRIIVSSWNPLEIPDMVLPPCHVFFQFYVENGKLSCKMYQRSGDMFLGVPFNIASYALITHIVAKMTGLEVGRLIHTLGDAHIYLNHVDQLKLQMTREPRELPRLEVKTVHNKIGNYTMDDIELIGYNPHPVIKGKVSVGLKNNTN